MTTAEFGLYAVNKVPMPPMYEMVESTGKFQTVRGFPPIGKDPDGRSGVVQFEIESGRKHSGVRTWA